jgi:hypothetical protein
MGAAMTEILMMTTVGTVLLAFVVDVVTVVAWLRGWR